MKINEILQNILFTILIIMLLVIFADYVSAYEPPLNTRANNQLMRRLGVLNRQQAVLIHRRDNIEADLQSIENERIRDHYHRNYMNTQNQLRDIEMRQESMIRMLQYPDIILVD